MKEYYFKDGTEQKGPFSLQELKGKNITASTPVWYHPLPKWTTAGEVAELKDIIIAPVPVTETVTPSVAETKIESIPPPVVETPVMTMPIEQTPIAVVPATETPVAEVEKPVTPTPIAPIVTTTTTTPVASTKATPVSSKPLKKKSTAWLSYVLSLLVLGGLGYLIYQDMEKNNTAGAITGMTKSDSTTNTGKDSVTTQTVTQTKPVTDSTTSPATTTTTGTTDTSTTNTVTGTNPTTTSPTSTTTSTPTTTTPTSTTSSTTSTDNNKAIEAQQLLAKKKADEDKKKKADADKKKQADAQAALTRQKADQDKQKQVAAQAMLAKEMQMRNNWPNYVTFGKLDYQVTDDGISAFNVPVNNSTDAVLDKVTVRVDYLKKENKAKVVHSETIMIYNIPPKSGMNGKAPEFKRGKTVNVFIIGITSRKLHFCYPQNNGNPADPYYCN